MADVIRSTAIYLRPGDSFDFGYLDIEALHNAIRVESTELTGSGMVMITGRIVSGRDRGVRSSWSVQFTQEVEYARPAIRKEEEPSA